MTDEERFLSLLPEDGRAVGNGGVRQQLGWDEEKYFRVRDRLLEKELIYRGKGRGGSASLVSGFLEGCKRALLELVPEDGAAVSNGTLMRKLEWDEQFYDKVRGLLLDDGLLQVGKGRGGSVHRTSMTEPTSLPAEDASRLAASSGPFSDTGGAAPGSWHWIGGVLRCASEANGMAAEYGGDITRVPGYQRPKHAKANSTDKTASKGSTPSPVAFAAKPIAASHLPPKTHVVPNTVPDMPSTPINIFFSYSHKDESLRDELAAHLATLRREGVITEWHDRCVGAGEDWKHAIDVHLDTAHIVLLLVSAYFIASDSCYEVDATRALERHARKEALVIPIVLRPTDWTTTPLASLKALPTDGKAVTLWANQDEAWLSVVHGLREAVAKVAATKRQP
jgi:hypothetical protein